MITKVELGGDDDLFNFRPCKDDIEASKFKTQLNAHKVGISEQSAMNSKKHDLYELIRQFHEFRNYESMVFLISQICSVKIFVKASDEQNNCIAIEIFRVLQKDAKKLTKLGK